MYMYLSCLICIYMYIHVYMCTCSYLCCIYMYICVQIYIYVCTHMYTLTHLLFFCMYTQVNTAGHILDDQQIHFVCYKRDFESRELVLSDARVNSFWLAIFMWPCSQIFRTSSSTPWNQILWIHAPWKVMYIYPKMRPSATATSHKCPSQWQDIRVWNDVYRHICIYMSVEIWRKQPARRNLVPLSWKSWECGAACTSANSTNTEQLCNTNSEDAILTWGWLLEQQCSFWVCVCVAVFCWPNSRRVGVDTDHAITRQVPVQRRRRGRLRRQLHAVRARRCAKQLRERACALLPVPPRHDWLSLSNGYTAISCRSARISLILDLRVFIKE